MVLTVFLEDYQNGVMDMIDGSMGLTFFGLASFL